MGTVLQDVRYALRQLIKIPGFTLTAVFSLALGIGATTAVFSVVYAVLIDPFPYVDSAHMVHMWAMMPNGDLRGFIGLTGSQWRELRKSPAVEDAFLLRSESLAISGSDVPEDVAASYLSSNAFNFLGVPPVLGRGLEPSDAVDGKDPQPVVVLSYKFWQRHFNSDKGVIGKTIQLLHQNYIIVGVCAPRFTWGDGDIYLPLKITGDPARTYFVETRLKPGISHAQADAALQPLIDQFVRETPKNFPLNRVRIHVANLNDEFIRDLGGTLYLLFGAVSLLLLIGCSNVSILLLARATAREHEFAVRTALGANRIRIFRQLLTESLLLSVSGAALGLLLAYKLLDAIVANLPEYSFPHEASIHINLPVLLFSIGVALGTGILFGLWPALRLSRPEINQVMQSNTRKSTRGASGRRAQGFLIAGQIALTLLLLAGAGAAIEGFLRIAHVRLGYDPHNIMSVGIPVHEGAYTTWAQRATYFEQLRATVAEVPGVTMAAISSNATPPTNGFNTKFDILGYRSSQDQTARLNMVSPEYFPALRIPLAQGRIWNQAENHRAAALVVVNQTFANRYFPVGEPVGHSIRLAAVHVQTPYSFEAPGADGWLQIVGVIEDKLDDGLSSPIQPEIFVPNTLLVWMGTQILVRSDVPPLTLLRSIQTKINTIDRDQQIGGDARDLEHWISRMPEWARGHLISWLFGAFAGLALVLASIGLFSVVSYTVAQRTNEFGIRIALGAGRGHVLCLVFNSTVISVGAGIFAGILLTLALNKVMASWAAESSRDPYMLLAATGILTLAATLACTLPAWRAAGVDPMKAIRYE
jgi:putative ABC transport system permease protein